MALEITFASIAAQFCDFLTVAIHTILYERHIYPHTTFITARKYNFPVRQSRHPKVCEWINDAVSSVHEELRKGTVKRVAIVIYAPTSDPLERFMFDISRFPVVGEEDLTAPIEREDAASSNGRLALVDLEEQFRATLSKLNVCGSMLKAVPKGSSYTLVVELKDTANPPMGHPQPWIPVQPNLQRTVARSESGNCHAKAGQDLGGINTIPVRAVDANELVFEMWIEEMASKGVSQDSLESSKTDD